MNWTAADYIVHGRYCDDRTMSAELRKLCRDVHAICGILLVAVGDQMEDRALLHVEHGDKQCVRELQIIMTRETKRQGRLGHLPMSWSRDAEQALRSILRQSEQTCVNALASEDAIWTAYRLADTERVAANTVTVPTVMLVLLAAKPGVNLELCSNARLQKLFVMANASVPIRVSREIQMATLAGELADHNEANAGDTSKFLSNDLTVDLPSAIRVSAISLLNAALHGTASNVGSISMSTGNINELVTVAYCGYDDPRPTIAVAADEPDSIVTRVYRVGAPLVVNDISGFEQLQTHTRYRPPSESEQEWNVAELAVPIRVKYPGAKAYSVLGVINIEKMVMGQSTFYLAQDVVLLQDIAHRFAVAWQQALFQSSVESLAKLTERHIIPEEPTPQVSPPVAGVQSAIPCDLADCISTISEMLQPALLLTRSRWVGVRMLSTDTTELLCWCTEPRSESCYPPIPLDPSRSVNAWTAVTGKPAYIPDLADPKALDPFEGLNEKRPHTVVAGAKSELCLPIVVRGRAVGTFNLESDHIDGYRESKFFIRAMVAQIGLSLAQARREKEQVFFAAGKTPPWIVHEIVKCTDKIRKSNRTVGDNAERLREECTRIEALIEFVPPAGKEATTLEIINSTIARRNRPDEIYWIQEPPEDIVQSPARARIIDMAVDELFRNRETYGCGDVKLCAAVRLLGGRRYLQIAFHQGQTKSIGPQTARLLYRLPIPGNAEDRSHLGAFLVGSTLRAIGGDVYLRRNDETHLVTVMELPLDGGQD